MGPIRKGKPSKHFLAWNGKRVRLIEFPSMVKSVRVARKFSSMLCFAVFVLCFVLCCMLCVRLIKFPNFLSWRARLPGNFLTEPESQ